MPDGPFEATAAIERGQAELSPELRTLARWISDTFDTDVMNIVVDTIQDDRVRMNVWVRTAAQASAFRDGEGNYDRVKQDAVAKHHARGRRTRVDPRSHPLVVFTAFEPEARNRAVDLRPAELEALRNRLAAPALWRILPAFGRVVFFVHTDAEVDTMRDTVEFRRWTVEFVLATGSRDEFDLVRTLPPRFELDSKERFERDFQGSTYYYLL